MIELSLLKDHLESIDRENWLKLFGLLDSMKKQQKFSHLRKSQKLSVGTFSFPSINPAPLVDHFLKVVYDLGIIANFDWPAWKEGREILKDLEKRLDDLNAVTLCQLLTLIIRSDRFNEGFLVNCFENGNIQRIISALKNRIYPE